MEVTDIDASSPTKEKKKARKAKKKKGGVDKKSAEMEALELV